MNNQMFMDVVEFEKKQFSDSPLGREAMTMENTKPIGEYDKPLRKEFFEEPQELTQNEKDFVEPPRLDMDDLEESGLGTKEYCERKYNDYISSLDSESEYGLSYGEFYDKMEQEYEDTWVPKTADWASAEMEKLGVGMDEYCNDKGYNVEDILTDPKEW